MTKQWDDALDLIDEIQKLVPDNRTVMNFKYVVLKHLDEDEDAKDVLDEMLEKHANYLFTRTEKAREHIRQKEFEETQKWLESYDTWTQFHVSEVRAYVIAKVELLIAQKQMDEAMNW